MDATQSDSDEKQERNSMDVTQSGSGEKQERNSMDATQSGSGEKQERNSIATTPSGSDEKQERNSIATTPSGSARFVDELLDFWKKLPESSKQAIAGTQSESQSGQLYKRNGLPCSEKEAVLCGEPVFRVYASSNRTFINVELPEASGSAGNKVIASVQISELDGANGKAISARLDSAASNVLATGRTDLQAGDKREIFMTVAASQNSPCGEYKASLSGSHLNELSFVSTVSTKQHVQMTLGPNGEFQVNENGQTPSAERLNFWYQIFKMTEASLLKKFEIPKSETKENVVQRIRDLLSKANSQHENAELSQISFNNSDNDSSKNGKTEAPPTNTGDSTSPKKNSLRAADRDEPPPAPKLAEQPFLTPPFAPVFAPGLPASLRALAGDVTAEIKAGAQIFSARTQDALLQADKMGKLDEFCLTINTQLANSGMPQARIYDIAPANMPDGQHNVVLEAGAGQRAQFNMLRATTVPEALPLQLRNQIVAAIAECKSNEMIETNKLNANANGEVNTIALHALNAALNTAAFQGDLNEFREAFNQQAIREGLSYRLKNNSNGSSDTRQIIDIERDSKRLAQLSIEIEPKAPVAAAVQPDVLADRVTADMLPFLKRFSTVSEQSRQRASAIEELERNNGKKELIQAYRTLDTVAALHEGADPVEASRRLQTLFKLGEQGNTLAQSFVNQLSEALGGAEKCKELLARLNTSGSSADSAVAQLKKCLPSAEDRMDELRLRTITQDLGTTSSAGDLDEALLYLENERKYGNKLAAKSIETVKTDRAALDLNDPAKYESAIKEITELAKTNIHALDLLAAIAATKDTSGQWQKLSLIANENEYAKRELPKMTALAAAQREDMILKAVQGLAATSDSNTSTIRSADAAVLAMVLRVSLDNGENNANRQLVRIVKETFANIPIKVNSSTDWARVKQQAIKTENALNGIFAAMPTGELSGTEGAAEWALLYTRLAASETNRHMLGERGKSGDILGSIGESFRDHIDELKNRALEGNPEATFILAAIAGGVGSANRHANPTQTNNRGESVPGNSLAVKARETLISAAQASPEVRARALNILSSNKLAELQDQGLRLCTLGTIAAINQNDISPKVREALRLGLSNRESHESAVRGMLALGASLDKEDLRLLALSVNAKTTAILQQDTQGLSPWQGGLLCDELAKRSTNPNATYDDRLHAVRALAALGNYHSTGNSLDVLKSFSGSKGAELIKDTLQGFPGGIDKKDEFGYTFTERFQAEAAIALLDISERSSSHATVTAAFEAFSTGSWGKAFEDTLRLSKYPLDWSRLHGLMKDNPENVLIQQGVPKLLHWTYADGRIPQFKLDANCDAARIAAAFKDRGTISRNEVLLKSSQLALEKFGKEKVGQVLDRMALFNALPADLQPKLSSRAEALPAGSTLPLKGRVVEAAVFNKLPEAKRIELFGSPAKLPETGKVRLKDDAYIYPGTFNNLPAEVQRALSGEVKPLLAGQSLSLKGKELDARLFNQLSDNQRSALTGNLAYAKEKYIVPDLSQAILTAGNVSKLSNSQKIALGFPLAPLPPGSAVTLRSATISAETFNELPPEVKIAINGSADNIEPGRVLKDLSQLSLDTDSFNTLDESLRRSVSATSRALDPTQVLRQLADGTMTDAASLTKMLAEPLEEKVKHYRDEAQATVQSEQTCLRALELLRKKAVEGMAKDADAGSGWFSKLFNSLSGEFTEHQSQFLSKQSNYIRDIQSLELAIQKQQREVQLAQARLSIFAIAGANMDFVHAQREGHTRQADLIAVEAFGKYGRDIFALAPDIAAELEKNGAGVNANPFLRLNQTGDTQYSKPPINIEIGKTPLNNTLPEINKAATSGLKMLSDIKPKIEGDSQRAPVFFSDAMVLRREAFAGITASPTISKFTRLVGEIHTNLQTLDEQVRIMQRGGDRYDEFLRNANSRADAIAKAFNELSADEKKYLYDTRASWQKTLKDGVIKDPEAITELKHHLEALEKGLQLFDADAWVKLHPDKQKRREELAAKVKQLEEMHFPGPSWAKVEPPHDDLYKTLGQDKYPNGTPKLTVSQINHEYWRIRTEEAKSKLIAMNQEANQRSGIDKVLAYLKSPEAQDQSNFRHWLKTDGLELVASIAGAVIATGIVVASGGSGALLLAAASTGGGILAREGIREFQHELGIRNQGCVIMECRRGVLVPDKLGNDRKMELLRDGVAPLLVDLATETAMSLAGGKVGHFFGEYLSRFNGSVQKALFAENAEAIVQLSKNVATIAGAAQKDAWWNIFLKTASTETFKQPLFSGANMGTEEALKQGAKYFTEMLDRDNKISSFLAMAVTSMAFRGIHPTFRAPKLAADPELLAARSQSKVLIEQPHLRFNYEGSPESVDDYINCARQRNSLILKRTPDGFSELTTDGTLIEFTRKTIPAETTPAVETQGKAIDLEIKQGDPLAISAQINELRQPIDAKIQALSALENAFAVAESQYQQALADLPKGVTNETSATKHITEHEAARRQYEADRAKLKEDLEHTKQNIEISDRYKSLVMALSMAEGVFPAGQYQLRVEGLPHRVSLTVGYMQPKFAEYGNPRRPGDADVSVKDVNSLLGVITKRGIVPESISIVNRSDTNQKGGFGQLGNNCWEIAINTGAGKEPVHLIWYHEEFHFLNDKVLQQSIPTAVRTQAEDAHVRGLEKGYAAEAAAEFQGIPQPERAAFCKNFNEQMRKRENRVITTDRSNETMFQGMQAASLDEIMTKFYVAKLAHEADPLNKGKVLTVNQLIDLYIKPHDPLGAKMMRGQEELFAILLKEYYPRIKPMNSLAEKPAPDKKPAIQSTEKPLSTKPLSGSPAASKQNPADSSSASAKPAGKPDFARRPGDLPGTASISSEGNLTPAEKPANTNSASQTTAPTFKLNAPYDVRRDGQGNISESWRIMTTSGIVPGFSKNPAALKSVSGAIEQIILKVPKTEYADVYVQVPKNISYEDGQLLSNLLKEHNPSVRAWRINPVLEPVAIPGKPALPLPTQSSSASPFTRLSTVEHYYGTTEITVDVYNPNGLAQAVKSAQKPDINRVKDFAQSMVNLDTKQAAAKDLNERQWKLVFPEGTSRTERDAAIAIMKEIFESDKVIAAPEITSKPAVEALQPASKPAVEASQPASKPHPAEALSKDTQQASDKKPGTDLQLLKSCFEHDCKMLDLNTDERAVVDKALADGSLKIMKFDRLTLRSHPLIAREPAPRASSQAELPSDASKYDPLKAKGPIMVVYDPKSEQYHVINGNNRIMFFGSEITNPMNCGVPVWLFSSPEAMAKVMGHDPRRNGQMSGYPFNFQNK